MSWSACEKAPWRGIRWSNVRSRTMKTQSWVWRRDIRWLDTVCSLEERVGGEHSCSSRAWRRPAPDRQTQRNSRPHMGISVPGDRYDTMCEITKRICLFDASLSQDSKCKWKQLTQRVADWMKERNIQRKDEQSLFFAICQVVLLKPQTSSDIPEQGEKSFLNINEGSHVLINSPAFESNAWTKWWCLMFIILTVVGTKDHRASVSPQVSMQWKKTSNV